MKQTIRGHAGEHRLGSNDPLDVALPYIQGRRTTSATITADTELDYGSTGVVTNDRKTFAWDPDDSPGLLIKRAGLYIAMVAVRVSSGIYASVERSILIKHGPLSSGPFPGGDFGSLDFYLGDGQGDSSLSQVTATSDSKSVLNAIGMQAFDPVDPTDPYRVAVLLNHQGTNFALGDCSFRIFRIGGSAADIPPLPPAS